MSEIGQMIQTSVLVVIASIYLTGNISDRKKNEARDEKFNQSLVLLSKAIDNVAKLVDLLKQSNDNSTEIFMRHDERSVRIDDKLTKIETIVSGCQKKGR